MSTPTRGRSCRGKLRHATRSAAERHVARLVKRGAATDALSIYACVHCGGLHVGHTPGRKAAS